NSKIDIGLIGCGGRGKWSADLFMKNGGYNLVAVADYFQDHADEAGEKFKVPAANRFTGLSGYRKLLEQKLDATRGSIAHRVGRAITDPAGIAKGFVRRFKK
ncbi:MAG: hypothetical protein ACXWC8_20590, partial [Limisphaerales bacterium]